MTRHARASEDLLLTRINNNPSFSQPNFSSLMARRELIEQLGDGTPSTAARTRSSGTAW